ncbi:MAG: HAD family hydrolase, partial [Verrucomicrobiota bacterium]
MQKKERGVIEKRYNLSARIEAEELSLDTASFVCTSTQQEVDEQYALYDFYDPDRMSVIPPGVDVSRFAPPGEGEVSDAIQQKIDRFLDDPSKPIILAIARADEKKNLSTLIKAYGASQQLQDKANLVIFAGNRDRISELNPGARKVWTELLQLIDDFDLYGKISIPKHHEPDEIPEVYRYAASKRGLFVNPAFIEPFGLTLIEAAASGLPMLATNDGGPRDIISNCQNGMLIDPESVIGLTNALEQGFANEDQWSEWVSNGLEGIDQHYTWEKHVETYLNRAADLISEITQPQLITNKRRSSLPLKTRMIFTGLEDRLQPEDQESISQLREIVECGQPQLGLGIVTGRSLDMVRDLIEELNFPAPDVVVTDLGGGIYYGSREIPDLAWESHLRHMWEPGNICALLEEIPGVTLQEEPGRQQQFKISYDYEKGVAPPRREIQRHLRENSVSAKVILSEGKFLDVIPLRSGKGNAIRYLTMRWGIPADRVLVHARRGSDYEALSGQFLAVLSADHSLELRKSVSLPRVFLSERPNYGGLLEGIFSYGFDDRIMVPDAADDLEQHDVSEPEAVLSPDMVAHLNEGE